MALRRRETIDGLLVVVLAVLYFASGRPGDTVGILLGVATVAPLFWWRRFPLAVSIAVTIAYSTWALSGYLTHPLGALPAALTMYGLGQSDDAMPAKAAGLTFLVASFLFVAVFLLDLDLLDGIFFVSIFGAFWAAGVVVAERRRYTAELEERTRQLQSAREALASAAVDEERARIARELHDIVSHSLSTITVQAGVGAHLADREPERALEALQIIETTGRSTMEELRRLLGDVRDAGSERRPQPGLKDIEDLVRQMESAGMTVELTTKGNSSQPGQMVQLSAYRLVQESLTNALKHAPSAPTHIGIDRQDNALEVEVVSLGRFDEQPVGEGLGLVGMKERVSMLGGDFEAGPTDDGWRVWARLPGEIS